MKINSINIIVPGGRYELSDKQPRYVYRLIASEHITDRLESILKKRRFNASLANDYQTGLLIKAKF